MRIRRQLVFICLLLTSVVACGQCEQTDRGEAWDLGVNTDSSDQLDTRDTAVDSRPSEDTEETSSDTARDVNDTTPADTSPRLSCLASADADCPVQDPHQWGNCDQLLGVVFDGETCRSASGCGCDENCPAFDSLAACASECGRAGECRSNDMPEARLGHRVSCEENSCGDLFSVCLDTQSDPSQRLERVAPDFSGTCEQRSDKWCCSANGNGYDLEQHQLQQLCGLTLLPSYSSSFCMELD